MTQGATTDIPGETGASYLINGSHFPGPGTYFLVARTTPACGTSQTSNEITVTVTDSVPTDTVQFFTITSKDGENVLEWLYPPGFGTVRVLVRQGSPGCTFPADPLDPTTFLSDESGAPGGRDFLIHSSLTNDVFYCYGLFVDLGGSYSAGRSNRGYPFDTTGDVKWAYSVGTTSMAPPGLGAGAIHAVANDNAIHSMIKGASGGTWPASWKPRAMMGPSQGRPTSIGVTASGFNPVIFLSSQDGHVYAFSAAGGDQAWMSPLLGTMVNGAPSGMFVLFGGADDHIFVGSRDAGDNSLYALDAGSGLIDWQYGGEALDKIGMVTGQAAVDYVNARVYFSSLERSAGASTLWAMKLDGSRDWGASLGSVSTGVTERGSTLYVGSTDARVHSIDVNGTVNWSIATGDGVVKAYVAPDRRTDDIYFATTTTVRKLSDDGSPPSLDWSRNDIPSPSTPTYSPGDVYVYVGASDGKLYQLDSATGATIRTFPLGDQGSGVGTPTLDLIARFVYVGTEAGVIYAIQLP
jgi:outer membrane protein assembly factor BamB